MTGETTNSKTAQSGKRKVLSISREKAALDLAERIKIGVGMCRNLYTLTQDRGLLTLAKVEDSKSEMRIWDDYNEVMLQTMFIEKSFYSRYISCAPRIDRVSRGDLTYTYAGNLVNWCRRKVDELKSFKEQLPLYEIAARLPLAEPAVIKSTPIGNKIFIVHGHNEGIKQTVARFLEKLDLDVVILHEQPNKGKTIMEKLEAHSSEVDIGYTVVLLTPDDIGKLASDKGEPSLRARQNVVFELGYFVGKLGRERICALKYDEIELPTDYQGVVYILLDANNAWQLELAKELKAVGFDIDLNKLAEKTK